MDARRIVAAVWRRLDGSGRNPRARDVEGLWHDRIALEFTFNTSGEAIRIFTPSRYRTVDGHFEPTPWQGHFGNYAERCGMWIPLDAEVSWQIAGSWQPWWRGRIVSVNPM